MRFYPVFIPTLNRFVHFRECVESLANCTHADKTELVIGLDYPPSEKYVEGYKLIKNYIPSIQGFAKVTVFEHQENLGPCGNWDFLVRYCETNYDAYIGTEDDNIFAPAFLDYMNKALEFYYNDLNILTVGGYNTIAAYNQGECTCYLSMDNNAWGIGCWVHKEMKITKIFNDASYFKHIVHSSNEGLKIINTYPALYMMLNDMTKLNESWPDVKRTTINILFNKYQLRPAISLVRNCGYDGSGIHCGGSDEFNLSSQPISNEMTFDIKNVQGSPNTKNNIKVLYYHTLSKDPQRRDAQLKKIFILYKTNTNKFFRYRGELSSFMRKIKGRLLTSLT